MRRERAGAAADAACAPASSAAPGCARFRLALAVVWPAMPPPRFEIPACPAPRWSRPAARAGRERGARAGARAPGVRRARRAPRVPGGRGGASALRPSRASARRSRRSSRTCRAASGSRSTATTTSTGSARRRCSCARCGRMGADVDSYLPDRASDGYGLSERTVRRLAARGTRLLVTRRLRDHRRRGGRRSRRSWAWTWSSPTTTPRAPTARCRARRSCTRCCAAIPVAELCATAVAYKLAQALFGAGGERDGARARAGPRPRGARDDRRRRAAARREPHARPSRAARAREHDQARAARADGGLRGSIPARVNERSVGFALAPRLNAAGRMYRADAGLELILTEDPSVPRRSPTELDRANARAPARGAAHPLRGRSADRRARRARRATCWPPRAGTPG